MKKTFHIGEKIQKIRKNKELTQEKLAENSGVSYPTLIKIERGSVNNPTLKTIKKIAKALNISMDKLSENVKLDDENNE